MQSYASARKRLHRSDYLTWIGKENFPTGINNAANTTFCEVSRKMFVPFAVIINIQLRRYLLKANAIEVDNFKRVRCYQLGVAWCGQQAKILVRKRAIISVGNPKRPIQFSCGCIEGAKVMEFSASRNRFAGKLMQWQQCSELINHRRHNVKVTGLARLFAQGPCCPRG